MARLRNQFGLLKLVGHQPQALLGLLAALDVCFQLGLQPAVERQQQTESLRDDQYLRGQIHHAVVRTDMEEIDVWREERIVECAPDEEGGEGQHDVGDERHAETAFARGPEDNPGALDTQPGQE